MNLASTNIIPYFLMKFQNEKFQWLNKEELTGRLNGGKVEVRPLPLWVIFLLKTLPLMLVIYALSNNFFLIREFFSLQEKTVALMAGATAFGAIYSLFMSRGGLRIASSILSLSSYMIMTYICITSSNSNFMWSFQVGVGATLYFIFILYAWWDILMIMAEQKQMFYVVNQRKAFTFWKRNKKNEIKNLFNIQLEGIFLNLYADQNYEVRNESRH